MKQWAKRYWGFIPFAVFTVCVILVALYDALTDSALRSVPFQILFWSGVCSVPCVLIWIASRLTAWGKTRIVRYYLLCIGMALLMIPFFLYAALFSAFSWKSEHIIERDGVKIVASVTSFLDVQISYYAYQGPLFHGAEVLDYEIYDFDPFEEETVK